MLELKTFIFYILKKFNIESLQPFDELDIRFSAVSFSENGIMIKFRPREWLYTPFNVLEWKKIISFYLWVSDTYINKYFRPQASDENMKLYFQSELSYE